MPTSTPTKSPTVVARPTQTPKPPLAYTGTNTQLATLIALALVACGVLLTGFTRFGRFRK